MKQIYEDLWQSGRYSLGVLNTHAYLLQREHGNALFYNTGAAEDISQLEELGGVRYQLLSHRDEVGSPVAAIKARFGSKLGIGVLEASFATRVAPVDFAFETTDTTLEDIQIIHTPGHTDGSVCYFYESPYGKSYLFTGDTLFQSNGEWSTFVIGSSGGTNAALADSLQRLRQLRPDVVMSSGFVGDIALREVTEKEWRTAIDAAIVKLR